MELTLTGDAVPPPIEQPFPLFRHRHRLGDGRYLVVGFGGQRGDMFIAVQEVDGNYEAMVMLPVAGVVAAMDATTPRIGELEHVDSHEELP